MVTATYRNLLGFMVPKEQEEPFVIGRWGSEQQAWDSRSRTLKCTSFTGISAYIRLYTLKA